MNASTGIVQDGPWCLRSVYELHIATTMARYDRRVARLCRPRGTIARLSIAWRRRKFRNRLIAALVPPGGNYLVKPASAGIVA